MVFAPVAYACRRLNPSTFLIIHDDKYNEHPFIYVKIYDSPRLVVIIDTGCGVDAPAQSDARYPDLRRFIEDFPVSDNEGFPLNALEGPKGISRRKRDYIIICTHCHYDHICGISSFVTTTGPDQDVTVIASSWDKSFLSRSNLPTNSICDIIGIPTPDYDITFARDGEWLEHDGSQLRLQIMHTPGHTPDSLAIYDEAEHWLFTGDSFYLRHCDLPDGSLLLQAISFPTQGNFTLFEKSVQRLLKFAQSVDSTAEVLAGDNQRLRIGCGHTTEAAPAQELLEKVLWYFRGIAVRFDVPIKRRVMKRGETWALWEEEGDPMFSLEAPERLRMEYGG